MTLTVERSMGAGAKGRTMAIGDFLLRRIREAGVEHAFGVVGDFSLETKIIATALAARAPTHTAVQ